MYPPPVGDGITCSCRLGLWIAEVAYNDGGEFPVRPWSLAEIYRISLVDPANSAEGLLPRLRDRMTAAAAAGAISTARATEAAKNLDTFIKGASKDKGLSLNAMLANGVRDDPKETDLEKLPGLLYRLRQLGIYMPNNHSDKNKTSEIKTILQGNGTTTFGLWTEQGDVAGSYRTFGSFTMRELFSTPLKSLSTGLFAAVRRAKRYAIIWPHETELTIGDPTTSTIPKMGELIPDPVNYGGPNKKCCLNGVCVSTEDVSYCGVAGPGTNECNSMSDPCT